MEAAGKVSLRLVRDESPADHLASIHRLTSWNARSTWGGADRDCGHDAAAGDV